HRPKELSKGRVATIAGKRLSITGFLRRPRSEAFAAARKAGAIIQSKPGRTTDVLVRGRPNQLQIAGEAGGTKLRGIRRLAAVEVRGSPTFTGEAQGSSTLRRVDVQRAAPRAHRVGLKRRTPPCHPSAASDLDRWQSGH